MTANGHAAAPPPEIDPQALERLEALGGRDFAREMLDTYREHGTQLQAELREALAAGDLRAIERAAHSLKSSAANLGAQLVRSLASEIERCARAGAGPIADLEPRVAALVDAFERSCGQLDASLEDSGR